MKEVHTSVLIAGGGPTGLVASLLLARLGISCVVLERNAGTDPHPRAHELNGRSVEILREAGIGLEELQQESAPERDVEEVHFCRTINETLARIGGEDAEARRMQHKTHLRPGTGYCNLSQCELEKLLVAHVLQQPLISLRFQHEWREQQHGPEGVLSTVLDLRTGEHYQLHSTYLLACDGASSPCRKSTGIAMEGPSEIQNFMNVFLEMNLRDVIRTPAKLYWILHPMAAGVFSAHHIDKRWVYSFPLFTPHESADAYRREDLQKRIGLALGLDPDRVRISSTSTWRMTAQVAAHYRQGRVFLVGDAAHRFPPTGGLGMNTGVADAHNLCWKLAAVLRGTGKEALLHTYEMERRPVALHNCSESVANHERIYEVPKVLGLDPAGFSLLARALHAPPLGWLPQRWRHALKQGALWMGDVWLQGSLHRPETRARLQRAAEAQLGHFYRFGLDLGYRYGSGALIPDGEHLEAAPDSITEYVPALLPGARLPHVPLVQAGKTLGTHDLFDYGSHTLIVRAPELAGDVGEWLRVVCVGAGCQVEDPVGRWHALCESTGTNALLVRPDGHIAWRSRGDASDVAAKLEAYATAYWRTALRQPVTVA